jgi:hypothetical protein
MKYLPVMLALVVLSGPALAQPFPAGHPPVDTKKESRGAPDARLPQKAKVLSTIDAAQYTYLEVTRNKKTLWLAAAAVAAKKGDVVRFDDGMVMTNFHSKTLNRTFPSVTFVNRLVITSEKE